MELSKSRMVNCHSRRKSLKLIALGLMAPGLVAFARSARAATHVLKVYKNPSCGCCNAWIDHMRNAGFQVVAKDTTDLRQIKNQLGIFSELRSCHTGVIDGYVIEGHVPAKEVTRLLRERPNAIGLAVPGMPVGSPGMEHKNRHDPFQVILFSRELTSVYATYHYQDGVET